MVDLQNEYNALLNVYEETQQNLKSTETEEQEKPVPEQKLAQKTIERESLPITQPENSPVQSSEIPEKSPVNESKPVVEPDTDDNLDAYARSFFKKILKGFGRSLDINILVKKKKNLIALNSGACQLVLGPKR